MRVIIISGLDIKNSPKTAIAAVYGWYRNGVYLYIGSSWDVFRRLSYHNVIGRRVSIEDGDEIHIWPSEDYDKLEGEKLLEHKPFFNTMGPNDDNHRSRPLRDHLKDTPLEGRVCEACGVVFTAKRWWQKFHSKDCRIPTRKDSQ
jgi:hypothetical protein